MKVLDHFAHNMTLPYVVAVTETTVIETPDENVSREILRGLYSFSSFKAARHFTTVVNDAITSTDSAKVAYLFQQKENENEQ